MVDRKGTDPSCAASHWDALLWSSTCFHGWCHHGKCQTTTCKYGITAPPAAAPQRKPTGLLDHHSTDRHGQSGEDRHVRKALVLVSAKSAKGEVFPVLAPNRPLQFAEQCSGLHREVPRGFNVGSANGISRQQTQVKRERKILEEWELSWNQEGFVFH